MRRYLYIVLILFAFTGIACPPAPPPVEPAKRPPPRKVDEPPTPIESDQLKQRIEAALEHARNRDLLTTHKFWTVFHGILGSGLERTMLTYPDTRKKVNAIEYICDGKPITGMTFIPTPHGLDVLTANPTNELEGSAQGHQDQFIAEMAQWGMPRDKKFKVGDKTYTFEAFIEHSKMRASVKAAPPQELSWAIIIIAQFYGTDHAWKNAAGEQLHFDDVVRYEVDATITEAACGGTHRLFGLTWAYHLHMQKGKKTKVWQDVEARIEQHKELAKKFQSPDRSLSTEFFKGPDRNPDKVARIRTSGHIIEWLALAMTDEELKSPWMEEAVHTLTLDILDMKQEKIDNGALYHAVHGLQLYLDRRFGRVESYVPLPPKK